MGWINYVKNSALKWVGRHGMAAAKSVGHALMPHLTKQVGAFYKRNRHIIDPAVGLVKRVGDVAGNVASGDIEGAIRSGVKAARSGSDLVKGISQGRGAPGSRGRKRGPEKVAEPSTSKAPKLSGDTLTRMTKLATT